ncbi:gelsolin repeat-containing protein [Stemphylium lycopersici]|nr:gelsolin repeat-containing protein [Stemphylium lycopersici]RAR12025.1 gelsolin repeat-containing protein [Stemphylium lycopersici]
MLSILRKARLKDKEMRILMLGLDNAGKTTIVKKIMDEDVNSVSPTLGFIIKTIEYDGIGDVGGQKTLRTYWKNYFEKTDTLIWVVDATDRERMDDCRQELAGLLLEERLSGASLLVFKNKSDVPGSMTEDEIRERALACVGQPFSSPTTMSSEDKEVDPSEFVQRIRRLGDQRDQEDAERVKKLEEELIQGRSERLARRAERARSISPDKPYTPQSPRSAAGTPKAVQEKAATTPAPTMSPPSQDAGREDSLQQLSSSPALAAVMQEDAEPKKAATSAAALGRSGTLSWKQRPQSGSIRRPLSMAARSPERPSSSNTAEASSSPEANPSRASIAASLGAKDPAFFRQTPDGGRASAAFRKNQDDTADETGSMSGSVSGRRQLPGMSRESTVEPDAGSPPAESVRSSSPGSRAGSVRDSAMMSNRFSTSTTISGGDSESAAKGRTPLPVLESQKFAPPSDHGSSVDGGDSERAARGLAMSPTQGRISPERERSASPTKGMGGFVQSAMLKRSDSVSKRWSTQTPPTLSRQNSTLSNRGSVYGSLSAIDRPVLARDNSIEPSRPASSYSNATITGAEKDTTKDEFAKPALARHSRAKSVASTFSDKDAALQDETSPPSPSKRWSPTKSSWLESALSKPPESPKLKQAAPAQPAWMAEINRIKQQRSSVDLGRGSPFGESSGSGRTSPIKDIQLKPVGLRRPESPKKDEPESPKRMETLKEQSPSPAHVLAPKPLFTKKEEPKPSEETPPAAEEPEAANDASEQVAEDVPAPTPTKPATPPPAAEEQQAVEESKPVASRFRQDTGRGLPAPKPKTPPKKDFRAGLKSRQPAADNSKKDEVNEFQNVFGRLRKAETKNYVAPDVLKDNITRGKGALNITGGPKPSVRKDEFRESLIKRRSTILDKAQEEGSALKRSDSISKPSPPTPEAIAKKKGLHRADSEPKVASPQKEQDPIPEALARKKSLGAVRPIPHDKPVQPAPLFARKEPALPGKLAGRFNPALAGMLARGPPPLSTDKSTSSAEVDVSPTRPAQEEKARPAPQLQHMTKGRARGPKRRAPAASKKATTESEQAQEKVHTAASVSLVNFEPVLSSSEPPKTNGKSEERPVVRTPVRQSSNEKPATPAKSARISSGNFGKASTPEPPKKPESLELNGRISESQATPEPPKKPESLELNRRISGSQAAPEPPKKPESLELNRRVSGSQATPEPPKKPESLELNRRISGPQAAPEPPKKPELLELNRRISASQITPKPSPRPESIGSPKISSPEIPKKPTSAEFERRVSGSHNTPQKSPLPAQVETPKSVSASPSPHSRFSRPLPTLPSKPARESPRSTPLREISTPNGEVSRATDNASPEKTTFSSVKSASSLWGRPSATSSPAPARVRSPIKLPTQADEQAAMKDAGLLRSPEAESKALPNPPQSASSSPVEAKPLPPKPKPAGLGFSLGSLGGFVASRSRESSPQLPKNAPISPPGSASRPFSEPSIASPTLKKNDEMFADFFDEAPVTEGQLPENIDTMQILKSPPLDLGPSGKIRTLRKQIQEVASDGKLSPVPMQEEHILFQDSMYLCTHVYGDSKGGKNTDVYLWAGNSVPEPTLEDVQVFAKNHARQSQGRLLIIRQGQETPNFFEALGGIVITRRGSKPAPKEFMLCGRRHIGHLAFDEVDFSLKSLCSAFPYLISTSTGKVYLWKGRGCSAEEVSGARLMGMDLAPTGDYNEIDEGAEPQAFLNNTFPPSLVASKGPAIPRSADHWRYKATSDKYRVRLYKVEQTTGQPAGWGQALQVSSSFFAPLLRKPSWNAAEQRPQTPLTPKSPQGVVKTEIKEIMPFSQRDLEPENIYVLDAFFEMYIIIGPLSRTQAPAFSTALMFAQAYGMLAVSEEDRPFMPVTTVILEGVPRDMKVLFRHWDDKLIPAAGLMSGKLGRGKSLRIVGLEKAIEATRR